MTKEKRERKEKQELIELAGVKREKGRGYQESIHPSIHPSIASIYCIPTYECIKLANIMISYRRYRHRHRHRHRHRPRDRDRERPRLLLAFSSLATALMTSTNSSASVSHHHQRTAFFPCSTNSRRQKEWVQRKNRRSIPLVWINSNTCAPVGVFCGT